MLFRSVGGGYNAMFFLYFSSVAYVNASSAPTPPGGVTRKSRGHSPLSSQHFNVLSPKATPTPTPTHSRPPSPNQEEWPPTNPERMLVFSPDGKSPLANQTKTVTDQLAAASEAARLHWEGKIKEMVAQHKAALKASQDALAEKNMAIETYKNQLMVAQGNLDKNGEEFRTKIDALTREIQEKSAALIAAQTKVGNDKQVAAQLAAAHAKIEAQRKEIAQKEVDLKSVQDTLAAEKRAVVEDYKNKLKEVIKGDTARAQKEKELQTTIDVLNKTLKEKDAALIAAQTKAGADKQVAAQLAAAHTNIADQKKELDRLARELEQRRGEISKLQASLTEEQKKVGATNQVSSQLAAVQKRIQELEEQKQRDAAESKATVERLEAVLKKREAQLQEEGTTLRGALKLIQEQLESANSQLNQKKQELNTLQMHVDSLEERVALQTVPEEQLKQELNDKIAAVIHLMEQLNDLWDRQSKSPVPAFIADLSSQTLKSREAHFINEEKQNRGNSSSPSPQRKDVVSPVKDQITALQRIIDDQRRIITDQKEEIAIFNGFWDRIAQQNPDTARNWESARSARTKPADQESPRLSEMRARVKEQDQLLARYTNLEHDYGRLLQERNAFSVDIRDLQQHRDRLLATIEGLQQQNKKLSADIRNLQQQLEPKTKPKGFCC